MDVEDPDVLDSALLRPATRELVESEVRRILGECSRHAADLLETERPRLDALVDALLEAETLDTSAAHRAAGVPLEEAADS
jgi:cell division protease FtsH